MAFFLTLLLYVGLFLLSELLLPKPNIEGAKPGGLGDFQFPTAEEGRAVPIVWGTVRLNGPNIGWYGDLRTKSIKEKVDTGLFSSDNVTIGHKYYIGIDFMLCRGEFSESSPDFDAGIRRIWVDDTVLRPESAGWVNSGAITIDEPEFFGKDSGGITGTLQLFPGRANQAQSVYMAAVSDIDSTLLPNYRGTVHAVMEQMYIGNAPSLRPWAFEVRRIPDGLGLGSDALVNGSDANPANVIYEIMTNSEWGLGLSNVDQTQMSTAGVTLAAENNGYARILDRPLQAVELLAEIEQQIDGFLVQDPITKFWQIQLIRETDYPSPTSLIPSFDESNILSLDFSRGSWADTANQVKVQFTDREKNFASSFAVAQDMANKIIQNDDDIIATQNYPAVQDRTLANKLAWRDLRTLSYPLAKGKIKADRSNYTLRPGDLARITWPPYGITDLVVRVNKISLGTDAANEMIYDWVEDIFRVETPSFADPTDSLWNPIADEPENVNAARIWPLPLGYQDVNNVQQFGLLASRGNGAQTEFDLYLREETSLPVTTVRTGTTLIQVVSPFTPTALLDGAVEINEGSPNDFTNDVITINTTTDIDSVTSSAVVGDLNDAQPPNLILVDDEIMFFESLTSLGGGQYTLNNVYRGMLDTAVARHDDNAIVWFFTYGIGVLEHTLDAATVGLAAWFMSSSGAGDQGDPNSSPTGSPEKGVLSTVEIYDRYLGPSAPLNVSVDGVRLGDVDELGDTFNINWRNRLNSFTDRTVHNESANVASTGYTYNVRVYHTGVSPEVEVYNQTGITADAGVSPEGGTHAVSGYAVDFSPITSPWASPQPFAQTYRIELEAVSATSPEIISGKWERDFTRA
jgi:hypothetical protein